MDSAHKPQEAVSPLRWFARGSGLLLAGFLALFVVGYGGLPDVLGQPGPVQLQFLGMAAIVLGAIAGWWRVVAGGVASLAGFVLFCAVELAVNGSMPGGVIPLFCLPGVSLLLAGLLGTRSTKSPSLG